MNLLMLRMLLLVLLAGSSVVAAVDGADPAGIVLDSDSLPMVEEAPVTIADPPVFLLPKKADVFIAVGVPYDLFFEGGDYYLFDDEEWYRSSSFSGPWAIVDMAALPVKLRRHNIGALRVLRDKETLVYEQQGSRYRGRVFVPAPPSMESSGFREAPGSHRGDLKK